MVMPEIKKVIIHINTSAHN